MHHKKRFFFLIKEKHIFFYTFYFSITPPMIHILFLLFAGNILGGIGNDVAIAPTIPSLSLQLSPPAHIVQKNIIITAQAALVMDVKSGTIVYKKNIHEKRPIASLTKLMTALLTLENVKWNEEISISHNAYITAGSQMHLFEAEKITIENLLKGLLIKSGNDAAVALAEHIAGSEGEFVEMMNQKAKNIGLLHTHYKNPHGLDEKGAFSTAFDVTLLAKKLIESPRIRKIIQTKKEVVTDISGKISHKLTTTNWLLDSVFNVYGVKTGTTENAGQCFVALVKIHGREYLITVLGSTERFADTKALLWAAGQ